MQKLHVVKLGGNIIDDEVRLKKFLADFAALEGSKILVHGGGKVATEISKSMGIQVRMLDGRRVTDANTLRIITMVYAGLINKNIVAQLQANSCDAIGLSGADANLLPAVKRVTNGIDFGLVGDVDPKKIKIKRLMIFLKEGLVPVFAPLTHDEKGSLLNTNADTIAAVLATVLASHYEVNLTYCFEKKGVLENTNNEHSLIPKVSVRDYELLKTNGVILQGMIPKLDNAFNAIKGGVKEVRLCHAEQLVEIINKKESVGTELCL